MPFVKKKKLTRIEYSDYDVFCLVVGRDFFRHGRFRHLADPTAEMIRVWPELRDRAIAMAIDRRQQGKLRIVPAVWWWAESPRERDESMNEFDQLQVMLQAGELKPQIAKFVEAEFRSRCL